MSHSLELPINLLAEPLMRLPEPRRLRQGSLGALEQRVVSERHSGLLTRISPSQCSEQGRCSSEDQFSNPS
jgi:hypothetical protein